MLMNPVMDKDDPTYVQMHSAISQEDTIRDSLVTTTANLTLNGTGTKWFSNCSCSGISTDVLETDTNVNIWLHNF